MYLKTLNKIYQALEYIDIAIIKNPNENLFYFFKAILLKKQKKFK